MISLQLILDIIILLGLGTVITLLLRNGLQKKSSSETEDDPNKLDIKELKQSIDNQITTMSASFNTLSKDVTRDMTNALTKVDEKVGVFNKQVEDLNKSQESFSKILAGVKKYGTLAEFSLASILKDLLPSSQYISNVKMKEETNENVEFAIKLQEGILVPIDSHFPVEKFSAINDAYQAKDKKAIADARDKLAATFRNKAKKVKEKYLCTYRKSVFRTNKLSRSKHQRIINPRTNEKTQSYNFGTKYSFSILTIFAYGISNFKSAKACKSDS